MNSYELNLEPIRELLIEIDDKTLRDNIRYEVQKLILEAVDITTVEIEKSIKKAYEIRDLDELINDDTEYCCYCNEEKTSYQCCQENHFQRFKDMSKEDQLSFIK